MGTARDALSEEFFVALLPTVRTSSDGLVCPFETRLYHPILRASFFVFRVKVCRDGAQVVVAAPRAIRSLRLQPHLGGNVEKLVEVVWSSRISSSCGDLRIVKELHRQFFLLLRLWDGCGLLDPFGDFLSATNN
jgi:hypothetical protein